MRTCEPKELECVKNNSGEENNCMQICHGLFITGFERRKFDEKQSKEILSKIKKDYAKYKAKKSITFRGNTYYRCRFKNLLFFYLHPVFFQPLIGKMI